MSVKGASSITTFPSKLIASRYAWSIAAADKPCCYFLAYSHLSHIGIVSANTSAGDRLGHVSSLGANSSRVCVRLWEQWLASTRYILLLRRRAADLWWRERLIPGSPHWADRDWHYEQGFCTYAQCYIHIKTGYRSKCLSVWSHQL